jgi:hypothetical protein
MLVTKSASAQCTAALLCGLIDVVLTFLLPRRASTRTFGNSPRDDFISQDSNFDVAVKQTSRRRMVW